MIRNTEPTDLAVEDRRTIEELAAALLSRWPVDSLVLYGSKARGDELAVSFDGPYAQRLDADYGDFLDIPRELVANTLETARRFVAAMQVAIEKPR